MLKPFANSARAVASGPLTWKTWTGLILVPALIMGLLTWAFWAPSNDHGTAKAAVVNLDEPVTVHGQLLPIGRQLAGNLTHSTDSAYTWVLTDASDAASGLADGTYAAAVTIPADFSARATSTASGAPLDARQAELRIETSSAAGVADPVASSQVARATQETLNQQVVETYLDNVYIAFSSIHDQLGQAADGAGQLADGTAQLVPGARQLADGSAQLATAAGRLSAGATQLADGTSALATGSGQLSSGLSQAERDTAQLPELTRQLADGARQVADGNAQLASVVVPLANRIIAAIDAMPSAKSAAAQFRQLASECGDSSFCDRLSAAADRFSADATKIDSVRDTVRSAAVQARDSIQALADGARRVADGNAQLASRSASLTAGIAAAARGARQLDSGIRQADTGAHQLASGAKQLSSGAGRLSSGAGQLRDGVVKVDDGAQQLATQLDKGRNQVPSYTPAERAHLKTVAATPTTSTGSPDDLGRSAVALFVALALWACALATYLITRAVPAAVQTSRQPSWLIIVRAALPGATAAALAAVALSLILAPVLHLGFARWLAFLGVALLAAGAFVALNQAAAAIFKRPGRLASLAVLVLTLATGVVSTLPSVLSSLTAYLPTHGAILALRAVVTDGPGAVTGVAQLGAWLAIGTVATIAITDRRRSLSAKQVRRGSFLPAAT